MRPAAGAVALAALCLWASEPNSGQSLFVGAQDSQGDEAAIAEELAFGANGE